MSVISFTVLGRPQPAGSKRAFVNPKTGRAIITDDAKKSRPWKQEVKHTALVAYPHGQLLDGPLVVEITFVLARPAAHMGTGRNAGQVRPSAPAYPIVRPDVDKLSRAVLDALTGTLWRDDAQVVRKTVEKVYGAPERCEVVVRPLLRSAAAVEIEAAA